MTAPTSLIVRLTEPADLRPVQLAWLAVAVFVVSAGYGALLPLLPGWLSSMMPGATATEIARHIGFLSGAYTAGVLVGAPLWGVISYRVGRSRILIIGLVGYVASLLLLLASFAPALHSASDPPLAQWGYGLPSLLAGLAWGLACLRGGNPWPVGLAVLAVIGLAAALGWQAGALQLAIGFGAVLACTALPLPPSPLTAFCARHSMGVYLVHPLCASALVRTLPIDHHGLALAASVMLTSLGVSVLLGTAGPTRILFGE